MGGLIIHLRNPACYEILHRVLDLMGYYVHSNEPWNLCKVGNFLIS
jgi:hypothetical protein